MLAATTVQVTVNAMADKSALLEGETLVLDRRPHFLYFTSQILLLVPVLFVAWVAAATDGWLSTGARWVFGASAFVLSGWTAVRTLQWATTVFRVTNRRVIWRSGIISRTGVEIPLLRINNVNFHQTIIERIVGAGDLIIESAGRDGQSRFSDIRHPDGVQLLLHQQIDALSFSGADQANPDTPGRAGVTDAHISDELRRLADLHQAGVLDDEEFRQAKANLLRASGN